MGALTGKIGKRLAPAIALWALWLLAVGGPFAWAAGADDLEAGRLALKAKQYDEAVRLLTQAIESAALPGDLLDDAHFSRGTAYRSKGDYQLAIADLNEAAHYAPQSGYIYGERGLSHFAAGQFANAAADFDQEIQLGTPHAYDLLWRHIARSRAGDTSTGLLAGETAGMDRQQWPGIIIDLFLGSATPDDVTVAAVEGGAEVRLARLCGADFYIGQYHVLQNDIPAARALFEQAVSDCAEGSEAHSVARAELSRLGSDTTVVTPPAPTIGASAPTVEEPSTDFFTPGSDPTEPAADPFAQPLTGDPFANVDWSSVGGIDIVFLPVAQIFRAMFADTEVLLYWGLVITALAMAAWWIFRPALVWIGRNILQPVARFLRRIAGFVGKVVIVLLAAYMALLGAWIALVEEDWLNGAALLAGFGLLTYVIAQHFLRGGGNELVDVAMDMKEAADDYADLTESF